MSISTLNDDLNILQNLAIPVFNEDVDVIQKLDDEPNDVGGLTAAELKAKFDEAGNRIKTYLNETLVPSISETVAEAEKRAEAEAARVLAEEQRVTAEQERVSAEAEREQAEAKRRTGETDRAAAEAARKTAEDARVLAEQKRVDTDSGIVAQATSAAEAAENAANKAASAAIHQPIVGDNGNWHTWSFDAGAYVDTGIYAGGDAPYIGENGNWYVGQTDTGVSATSSGVYVGSGDMPGGYNLQIDPDGEETDFIPYIGANGNWFVGDTDLNVPATGPIGPAGPVGPTGATGPAGPAGSDGQDGITPTIGDNGNWYLGDTDTGKPSRGETGQAGADGRDGADGQPGADGKSAYQYAVEGGYTGTEEAFAAKLAAEIPTALPNPNALTFTGAVTGSYDGSAPVSVEIPSGGGSSGGSGKAKSQILIDQEITGLTASLSVTLEHDFHYLTAIISCGSDGVALTAGSDGTAVASKIGLMVDATSFDWNQKKVAYTDTSTGTWSIRMFGAEWSDDLSVFKRCFTTEITTGISNKAYFSPFGGKDAMYGTLVTDDNAPRTGKTANIVVNGAYLNVGTRVVLWGEYYE